MTLQALRRTTAEILANALSELFPQTTLIDCIVTDIGFHYDVILKNPIDLSSLPLIEERMRFLAKQNLPIKLIDMMRQNAAQYLAHHGQKAIAEKAQNLPDNIIQILQMGDFVDICTGPCLNDTSKVRCFKLQGIQQVTPEITRIYGTAFNDNYELKQFLKRYAGAKAKDHSIVGEEMGLFNHLPNSDSWIWLKSGNELRRILIEKWRKVHEDQGFENISVPLAMPTNPKQTDSLACIGDLDNQDYTIGGNPTSLVRELVAKKIKKNQSVLRYSLLNSTISNYPNELLCGLFRTRIYTTDLAYIFCSKEQVAKELISSLHFINKIIKIFGFEHQWNLCIHRASRSIPKARWDEGVKKLSEALEASEISCSIDKETDSQYGPRVEIRIADAFGRYWPGPSVSIDMTQKLKSEMDYELITRSSFGSVERFIGLMVEHFSGDLSFMTLEAFLNKLDQEDGPQELNNENDRL